MSRISTHVLDTALGRPAAGIMVRREPAVRRKRSLRARRPTRMAGARIFCPTGNAILQPGQYRLRFETGTYYGRSQSLTSHVVEITRDRAPGDTHLHVPLLLSPMADTTYRGS